jgi:transcriptional regulatory protein RtcR
MAQQLAEDIALLSPQTTVRPHTVNIRDPWDFEEVYAAFLDFASHYDFDTERRVSGAYHHRHARGADLLVLLTEARYLPASLLQTSPAPKGLLRRMLPPAFTRLSISI